MASTPAADIAALSERLASLYAQLERGELVCEGSILTGHVRAIEAAVDCLSASCTARGEEDGGTAVGALYAALDDKDASEETVERCLDAVLVDATEGTGELLSYVLRRAVEVDRSDVCRLVVAKAVVSPLVDDAWSVDTVPAGGAEHVLDGHATASAEMIATLLELGAQPKLATDPLHEGRVRNASPEVVELLASNGATASARVLELVREERDDCQERVEAGVSGFVSEEMVRSWETQLERWTRVLAALGG